MNKRKVKAVVDRLATFLEKCEATGKPGPCAENRQKPEGDGRKPAADKPISNYQSRPQAGISSYAAKPFKSTPEAKAILDKVKALRAGKAAPKDAALVAVQGMKKASALATTAIAQAEKKLTKLQNAVKARQKLDGAKKVKAATIKKLTGRIKQVTALIQKAKARGGESEQKPKEPKKSAGVGNLNSQLADVFEGMVADAEGFHQAAGMAMSITGGSNAKTKPGTAAGDGGNGKN